MARDAKKFAAGTVPVSNVVARGPGQPRESVCPRTQQSVWIKVGL